MSASDAGVYIRSGVRIIAFEADNEDFDIVLAILYADQITSFPATVPVQIMGFVQDDTLPFATLNWTSLKGTKEEIYSNPKSPGTGTVTLTEWDADEMTLKGEFSTVQIRNDMATSVSLTGVFYVQTNQNPFLDVPVEE